MHAVHSSLLFVLQRELQLYALDPVGSYGLLLQTPSKFLGFNSKQFWRDPGDKDRARVVLMSQERRIGFSPNVYEEKHGKIEQVGFNSNVNARS